MTEVYRYGLRNRPPMAYAVPKGWTNEAGHPRFRHGTIDYAEPLTAAEMYRYELQFVDALEDGVSFDKPCGDCDGDGRAEDRNLACPVCDGTGRTERV